LDDDDDWFDATPALIPIDKKFDEISDYKHYVVVQDTLISPNEVEYFDDVPSFRDNDPHHVLDNIKSSFATQCTPNVYLVHRAHTTTTSTSPIAVHPPAKVKRDYDASHCFFGNLPSDVIKNHA
jgi:hypothetical protein